MDDSPVTNQVDVVIVGAGPAGLSAAVWAHTLELSYVLLESEPRPGGQLHRVYNRIVDYLGFADIADGADLAKRFAAHLDELGVRASLGSSATRIDANERVAEFSGERIAGRFIVLETGVRRRTLGVPGEAELVGRGVSPSASKFAEQFRGLPVLVVGGGDAAFEEALILAEVCDRVTLVHRGDTVRARPDFRERARTHDKIEILPATELKGIEGNVHVEGARLSGPNGDVRLDVAGVFVCVGVVPNTELVAGQIAVDERGYVVADARQRTSIDGVYAAGDVCSGSSLTIAAAVGQGAGAVKDIQRRLARVP